MDKSDAESYHPTVSEPKRVDMPDADVVYCEGFLSPAESSKLFARLRDETDWRQDVFTLYGREIPVPRLTAWHGDPGAAYSYSGLSMAPAPWSETLLALKRRVEEAAGARFNSVLLNLYRSGADSVDWHADDEKELGPEPVIAAVSLGAVRSFQLRHAKTKERVDLSPAPGSLLIMRGASQRDWRHRVPKTKKPVGERISLTFRAIRGVSG